PYISQRNKDLQKLTSIIREFPGSTQNALITKSGMKKQRVVQLLKEGIGKHWQRELGPNKSMLFFSIPVGPKIQDPLGPTGPNGMQVVGGAGGGRPLRRGRPTPPPQETT